MKRIFFSSLAFAAFCLALVENPATAVAQESSDSWALRDRPNARIQENVERWCEIGGKKVRFANFPIPGYEPCGSLSAQKSCDPTGKRFFGAGQSPYSYLDCSRGQRMQIVSDRTPPQKPTTQAAAEPVDTGFGKADFGKLDQERNQLDALLDGTNDEPRGRARPANRGQRSASRGRAGSQNAEPDEMLEQMPLDRQSIAQLLKTVQQSVRSHNDQLNELLNDR